MRILLRTLLVIIAAGFPAAILASPDALQRVYDTRADLRVAFDATSAHRAVAGSAAGVLVDLEDWAREYGWKEHPELSAYAPLSGASIDRVVLDEIEDQIGAHAYVVMDRTTGKVLTMKRENVEWSVASLTKLVTADVVLDYGVSKLVGQAVRNTDNVGGARLWVGDGERFTVGDLFYATLVASANNAANALSRSIGISRARFLEEMNARPKELGLKNTHFVDPTGIEVENLSTPLEMITLARSILDEHDDIRKYTTTATKYIHVLDSGERKKMTNTNWMLWKPQYDDVYVTAGKTGYLHESKWNLIVGLRPNAQDEQRELLILVFGAESRGESFEDARTLSEWAWGSYAWNSIQ